MLTLFRYHRKCLKIPPDKLEEDTKYTCPVRDYRVKIPRGSTRPSLEDLIAWLDEILTLQSQPDEEECLDKIIRQISRIPCTVYQPACVRVGQTLYSTFLPPEDRERGHLASQRDQLS